MLSLYRYDSFNRLVSYDTGTTHAKYTYYADNLRASKTVNGTTTDFVWNGQNLAIEQTGDSSNVYTYDMTGIHTKQHGYEAEAYIKDTHGNIVGASDEDGVITSDEYDYTAFGEILMVYSSIVWMRLV